MKRGWSLVTSGIALLALALVACRATKPCREGTAFVTCQFHGGAENASAVRIARCVAAQGMTCEPTPTVPATVVHAPGKIVGTMELAFDDYPAGSALTLSLTALDSEGRALGPPAITTAALVPECTSLDVPLQGSTQDAGGACVGLDPSASSSCAVVGTTCLSATSLQTCADLGDGCLRETTSTCDTNLVCERVVPASCVDPAWAAWPIANGADGPDNAPRLSFHGNLTERGDADGTVTDEVTGLMWQQSVSSDDRVAWDKAASHCQGLRLGGHVDWRWPTRIELISLVDYGRANPAIDPTFQAPAARFWTATDSNDFTGSAWFVDFASGEVGLSAKLPAPDEADDHIYYVRCVR